ncbi:hypothetical protein GGQ68_002050 [Sagittula marina]|uniref:Uncharacterized protein n=1 Tax=Sagittula marina TaxID=943940 RepID=A0A7W6DMZ2_9RHOB|nr:hypothetical protein [Sagittula marina]MBB3985717.1 hypothetical protein [Sagittula marina]
MKHILAAALTALTALPAFAAEPLTARDFESYVDGKTLYYGLGGDSYGVEEYLPDRRVRWSFMDGECKEGYWYEAETGNICFVYEDAPNAPQCWSFFQDGSKLRAVFENDASTTVLYEAQQDDKPMLCYGPKIGV